MKLSRLPPGFGLDTAAQALALRQEAVSDVVREWTDAGWRATATVRDGGTDYHAMAELTPPPDPVLRSTGCTCGRYRCRHVAALVLSADAPDSPRPALKSAVVTGSGPDAGQAGAASPPAVEALDARAQQWLSSFDEKKSGGRGRQYELRYVLRIMPVTSQGGPGSIRRVAVGVMRVPVRGDVAEARSAEHYGLPRNLSAAPAFARRDADLLRLLEVAATAAHLPGRWDETLHALGDHPATDLLIELMLDSGRLCWETADAALHRGESVQGMPGWATDERGMQFPTLTVEGSTAGGVVLPLPRPWLVRPTESQLVRVTTHTAPEQVARFLAGPTVSPAQAAALAHAITAAGAPLPVPQTVQVREERLPFTPQLHLMGRTVTSPTYERWTMVMKTETFPLAELRPAYGGLPIPQEPVVSAANRGRDAGAGAGRDVSTLPVPTVYRDGILTRVPRDPAAEKQATRALSRAGFATMQDVYGEDYAVPRELRELLTLGDDESWLEFMRGGRTDLEARGFTIHIHPDFPLAVAEISDWYGETEEGGGNGWFTLDLGIVVDGERVSLIPVLADLIARQPDLFTPEALNELKDEETIYAALGDGRRVALPAGRVRAILSVLVELNLRDIPDGPLRLPLLDAARLAQLEGAVQARWVGAERLLELGRKLRDFGGIQPVQPPVTLNAELRPYQLQGLAWLQFLREYELGGILADDMGLGKTVMTLAHLLTEKAAGRADRPSMVVAPTSVIGNWQAEAARFAPSLRVLTLHGKDRRSEFGRIPDADLILTTYPLLPRDVELLSGHAFHMLILDEAQNIKNSKTAAAKAAGSLDARHRLCLTGTPLENHLGELWSQFNFLAPGLLHDERTFRELYRTPIEKKGDPHRRAALAARVRPFILRREKRDVARELPPKTEIPVRVTLDGDQRDLYETVRVTMESRVREELQARGLARSTIAILDALLKLRQAVTDPRLVKLDAARKVKGNAKLDWLESNLPQMIEEGRRVLIFSGFATLLGHLEDTLKARNIPYSKITGQTQKRQEQIDAFQSGETHVFLITLKAGGVGLNLTAADTVIHYDPWWNPAAEDQATDRAYRIGQDKPVFVYKLIAAGSVEEKILDLQARKAALARGILDGGLSDATQLTTQDLDRLFAPLEDGEED
ncbi:DEAD/DEAH box helicase [Deinococcus sp. Arct2-2]|uniref:DEAD/DEAH box helicase n=1 Tax=Deinococcus sp. Arct2-2 TaxID=2568653 RepID=UPI0010A376BC|nr:DEAD/DEAH box helicase [Deinococcus sp. Arct2-2]THF71345.1 DEAD/DEAH box helicase [Deinococcus sp. Arct2-2]